MAKTVAPQTYENHKAGDKLFFSLGPLLLLPLILAALAIYMEGASTNIMLLAGAIIIDVIATIVVWMKVRLYALVQQDRIIRLEMQLRLQRVLPADQQPQIAALSLRQLISLRFASDAELPGLVRRVIAENIEKGDDIKKMIKDWQPDHQRV